MDDRGSSSFSLDSDLTAYSDDVDLSGATALLFDSEVTGRSILAGSGTPAADGEARVRISFRPDGGGVGTVELWSRTDGPGTDGEQVRDERIPRPDLPTPGRLTLEVSADPVIISGGKRATQLTFRLDDLGGA